MQGKNWVLIGVGVMVGILAFGWWRDRNVVAEPVVPGETSTSELESGTWRLQDHAGEGGFQTVIAGTEITARFEAGTMTGNAGCNSYFADYTLEGEQLTIGMAGSTMMACDPPVMDQEQAYLALLPQVKAYTVTGAQLILLNEKDQGILIYNQVTTVSLENTLWQATGVNNGKGGVETTGETEMITARFVGGDLSGQTGCNQYSAAYETDDQEISIWSIRGTLKACESTTLMDQEVAYYQALEQVNVYSIQGDELELRDGSGALQVSFRKQ